MQDYCELTIQEVLDTPNKYIAFKQNNDSKLKFNKNFRIISKFSYLD